MNEGPQVPRQVNKNLAHQHKKFSLYDPQQLLLPADRSCYDVLTR